MTPKIAICVARKLASEILDLPAVLGAREAERTYGLQVPGLLLAGARIAGLIWVAGMAAAMLAGAPADMTDLDAGLTIGIMLAGGAVIQFLTPVITMGLLDAAKACHTAVVFSLPALQGGILDAPRQAVQFLNHMAEVAWDPMREALRSRIAKIAHQCREE